MSDSVIADIDLSTEDESSDSSTDTDSTPDTPDTAAETNTDSTANGAAANTTAGSSAEAPNEPSTRADSEPEADSDSHADADPSTTDTADDDSTADAKSDAEGSDACDSNLSDFLLTADIGQLRHLFDSSGAVLREGYIEFTEDTITVFGVDRPNVGAAVVTLDSDAADDYNPPKQDRIGLKISQASEYLSAFPASTSIDVSITSSYNIKFEGDQLTIEQTLIQPEYLITADQVPDLDLNTFVVSGEYFETAITAADIVDDTAIFEVSEASTFTISADNGTDVVNKDTTDGDLVSVPGDHNHIRSLYDLNYLTDFLRELPATDTEVTLGSEMPITIVAETDDGVTCKYFLAPKEET